MTKLLSILFFLSFHHYASASGGDTELLKNWGVTVDPNGVVEYIADRTQYNLDIWDAEFDIDSLTVDYSSIPFDYSPLIIRAK